MTDNEIKKALECCAKSKTNSDCRELKCPFYDDSIGMCGTLNSEQVLMGYALDLINRLQAENEDKQTVIKEQGKIINGLVECQGKAIIAAYEEFAELVKANKRKLFNFIYSSAGFDNQIDNLLKELVGE